MGNDCSWKYVRNKDNVQVISFAVIKTELKVKLSFLILLVLFWILVLYVRS